MTTTRIELPEKLVPVFTKPARYRCAFGGRGSGKTRSFARMSAVMGAKYASEGISGIILCARQFMNSLAESSFEEVKSAIEGDAWLSSVYEIGETYIRTRPGLKGRVDYAFAGLSRNLNSIKSKARILICWIDEAEDVLEVAWRKLIPTVREEGEDWHSEIWATWNPESSRSATHKRFRENPPDDAVIAEINWRDNPWFPRVLESERLQDKVKRPDVYGHIWEGEFVLEHEGAYFAKFLNDADRQGRISNVVADDLVTIRSYHDIGGAGARADAYAIWIVQFVGREIRVLDYYESQGQVLSHHVNWMREKGYTNAEIILPHDGVNTNNVTGSRYEDHWRQAEFKNVRSIPNMGQGAAMLRVRAAQRLFPQMWFNRETTTIGRETLAWYHEKRDEVRQIGLGPNHDWSSHGADAFGLMAVDYQEPSVPSANKHRKKRVAGAL